MNVLHPASRRLPWLPVGMCAHWGADRSLHIRVGSSGVYLDNGIEYFVAHVLCNDGEDLSVVKKDVVLPI